MKHYFRMGVAALLITALLLTTPLLGCGGDEEEGKTVITIGMLTDLTGPAGPALVPLLWALQDQIKYINAEDPIPGAELKLVTYDTKMDAARTIPGYEWLKERGSEVIVNIFDYDADALKPFAEKDKLPLASLIVTDPIIEPPGWVFCINSAMSLQMVTVLEWIGDQWDDGQRLPKIGYIAPNVGAGIESEEVLREYCQDHSDKFDWVESFLVPYTTMSWSGETEKLKDCDWIAFAGATGMNIASFVEQYRAKGYQSKFFGQEGVASFWGYVTDKVGFEALDGSVFWVGAAWWSDPYPVVDLLKQLLNEYHPAEADKIMRESIGYIGGGVQMYFFLQLLQQAIEEVGAEDFDGQAFYDTAVNFKLTMEGFEEWGFSATKRYCQDHGRIHKVNAEAEDLEIVGEWVPLLTD